MMQAPNSIRMAPQTPFAPRDDGHAARAARHTPRQNELLAALPAADHERLLPLLEPVPLPLGWTIYAAGDWQKHVYFITEGIVSRFNMTQNGASAESAITGREGVIGVASFLGGESMPDRTVVVSAGYAYRLGTVLLDRELRRDGALPRLLLRYIQALIAQTGQIAVCNRYHSLDERLCRWILSCLDRLSTNALTMTQEVIANMLGVRRESITTVAGRLQRAGLIERSRGHLIVLDRQRLETQACECYAAINREYDRLLRPPNKSGEAGEHGELHRYRSSGARSYHAWPA